jgi:hypothetical protein
VTLQPGLNGQTISLLRNGEVVGKAIIAGDAATIPADLDDSQPKPGELEVALEPDGAAPAKKAVGGVPEEQPPPPPPPAKTDTTVTMPCPTEGPNDQRQYNQPLTTSGTIQPAFAGATIKVTYTRPDLTTFERTATTDANGAWSDTIIPTNEAGQGPDYGNWKVKSRFDGDSAHNASPSSQECTFVVYNNS